jgi:alpha-L-rhamnosidase
MKKITPFDRGTSWVWSKERSYDVLEHPSPSAYQVRRFRRVFEVGPEAREQILFITADSRYEVFLDGCLIGRGPAHGDVRHHFYDTYRFGALKHGKHVLAVRVFDYSKVQCDPPRLGAPAAVMTRTGGLAAELWSGEECVVRTDESWRVEVDRSLHFQLPCPDWFGGFVGLFEDWHCAEENLAGWTGLEFEDSAWAPASLLYEAERREKQTDAMSPYGLMERLVPMPVRGEPLVPGACRRPGGGEVSQQWLEFSRGNGRVEIPAETVDEVLIEFDREWTGFPRLDFSGGNGAEIRVGYAEALRLSYDVPDAVIFGRDADIGDVAIGFQDNRSGWTFDSRGRFEGFEDLIRPDGREWQWQPHHWRAAKFVRLRIQTGTEPLTITGFRFEPEHYPLRVAEELSCSDRRIEAVSRINFHTLLLGMHETFTDCPYYEQLQYIGDSSLNAQVAMLGAGDYDAARQLLLHFDWSRVPEGWTQSRYPSRIEGIIPSQSLDWLSAIHSFALMCGDMATVREVWPGACAVLDAYHRHLGPSGLPQHLPFWNWIDWCPGWKRGVPPGAEDGPVLSHAAKLGMALQQAIAVAGWLGEKEDAERLRKRYELLRTNARAAFWNGAFFAENAQDPGYGSRLGNAYAVLAGFPEPQEREGLNALLSGDTLADCSFFGYFFVRQALWETGGCDLQRELQPWFAMLDLGLTTWAEDTVFWRSLCHGWSANPQIDFYTRLLGVRPTAPGFAQAVIEPAIDAFEQMAGSVMTPHGAIRVAWDRAEAELTVDCPREIRATLVLPVAGTQTLAGGCSTHELPLRRPSGRRSPAPAPVADALA